MLLVANLTNTKRFKKSLKWLKPWQMGTHLRRGLSYEYPDDLVRMIFVIFCILVHLMKVASALEGLNEPCLGGQQKMMQKAWKWLKPCHMGTHLRVLGECYPMNTNMIGFRCFSKILVIWMNVALALEGLRACLPPSLLILQSYHTPCQGERKSAQIYFTLRIMWIQDPNLYEQLVLNPFAQESIVCYSQTFENNLEIKQILTKYLKESCW